MQDRMNRFQFAKRSTVVSDVPTLILWNKIRNELSKNRQEIFGAKGNLHMTHAVEILIESGI